MRWCKVTDKYSVTGGGSDVYSAEINYNPNKLRSSAFRQGVLEVTGTSLPAANTVLTTCQQSWRHSSPYLLKARMALSRVIKYTLVVVVMCVLSGTLGQQSEYPDTSLFRIIHSQLVWKFLITWSYLSRKLNLFEVEQKKSVAFV